MGKLAGSGGHNKKVQGANSEYGKEHVEDRRFLDAVAKYVQAAGWDYVNCSDEVGTTKAAVWGNAANNHLRVVDSDVDLQFHLNATPGGTGCEVWLHPKYGDRVLAAKISKAMADAFGLKDRGIQFSTELGWINKTKTGLLPEICFIDNPHDMDRFYANFDKAAKAVAEVIVGKKISGGNESGPDLAQVEKPEKPVQSKGIGIAISKYREGYGVNLYAKPVSGFYNGRISDKTPYLILEGYWLGGDNNMLCLGGAQWAPQKHFDVQWFKAYSKYPPGYGINTYSAPGAPDGSYLDKVDGSVPYDIYYRKDGWIAIDNKRYVEEKHFDIR